MSARTRKWIAALWAAFVVANVLLVIFAKSLVTAVLSTFAAVIGLVAVWSYTFGQKGM